MRAMHVMRYAMAAERGVRRRDRAVRFVALVLASGAIVQGSVADVAGAQASPVGARTRSVMKRVTAGVVMGENACTDLESSPSPLVHAPEGLTLLRLKRQLESAALTLQQRQQLERDQLQRIAQVQRGMDSLIQIVVRVSRDEANERPVIERRLATGTAMPTPPPIPGASGGRRMIVTIDSGDGPVTVNIEGMMRGMVPPSMSVPPVDSTMATRASQLERVIRLLQPKVAAFAVEAEASLPSRVVAPSGYMGLSLSGAQVRIVTPDGVMTNHCEYPLVETVDVGSPASRAGLAAGDTLVAYNGHDVTQAAVNYAELITAGSTVKVRVRRSGRPREVPVQVEARRDDGSAESARLVVRGMPLNVMAPGAMFSPSGLAVLAGAQFTTMDAEFAQRLGLEPGVLVLRVPTGTPAADAGLKAGEVVRAVNGTLVRDVAALRRALAASREARLTVQGRGSAARVVVLDGR